MDGGSDLESPRARSFVHDSPAQRVRFAPGAGIPGGLEEVRLLQRRRAMVIAGASGARIADAVGAELPGSRRHTEVVMHVPQAVVDRAVAATRAHRSDVLVTVGGGSATGLAKMIALSEQLPIVAIPTTFSGSEATAVWGRTVDGRKETGTDRRVLPQAVVYDAELLRGLSADALAASGMNALAHAIDAMWAPRTDPIAQSVAFEGGA